MTEITVDEKAELRAELQRLLESKVPHSIINGSYQDMVTYKMARREAEKSWRNPRATKVALEMAVRTMHNYSA